MLILRGGGRGVDAFNVRIMIEVRIEPVVARAAGGLRVLTIEAEVTNHPTPDALREMMESEAAAMKDKLEIGEINKRPAIAATRRAYKALGKEPNRYRPSAEALCRRVVRGLGLYYIDALVDIINLISLRSGYSIGGFDADKIEGAVITLGRGEAGEPYEGIGRGPLNIEGMPVYRDAVGGIGTPTSDHERTKITGATRRLLMVVNAYGAEMPLDQLAAETCALLRRFCDAGSIEMALWTVGEDGQAVMKEMVPVAG